MYLEKIASNSNKEKSGFRLAAIPGVITGGMIAGGIGGAAIRPMHSKVMGMVHENHSSANLGTIKKMIRDNKLNVSMNHRAHSVTKNLAHSSKLQKAVVGHVSAQHHASPAFSASGNLSKGTKDLLVGVRHHSKVVNKDVIMHELGHAKDFSTHKGFKTRLNMAGKLGGSIAPLLVAHDKTKDYAVPLAAVSAIPTLRSEAMANVHAYKGIKAHQGVAAAKSFAKRLLPSQMGVYAAGAGVGVASTYLAKKITDKLSSKS